MRYKSTIALLLDIDGVIVRGPNVIPNAPQSIQKLKHNNIPFLFLTNSGGCFERDKANDISKWMNTNIDEKRVILSHTPMQLLAERYKNEKVLIVGRNKCSEIAKEYGFNESIGVDDYARQYPSIHPFNEYAPRKQKYPNPQNDKPFKAILVMHDPRDYCQDLQICVDILSSTGWPGYEYSEKQIIDLYMSNPDLVYSSDFPWPRFGQGLFKLSLQAAFKAMTGNELSLVQYGKPERKTYEFAEKRLLEIAREMGYDELEKIYAIGDNPAADIRGANNAGEKYVSVLTRTGVFRGKVIIVFI